jgi:hypothetical protein
MIKRLFTLLVTTAFALSLASPALSAAQEKEVNGVVNKIEGSKITVLDSTGNEETIELNDPEALKVLKVGDRISMKDDVVKKEGAQSPAPVSRK